MSAIWAEAVTNRTQSDVDRVKYLLTKAWNDFSDSEKEEFRSGMKGAINHTDLERITSNLGILIEVLELSITVPTYTDDATESFYSLLISCVDDVRNAYMTYTTTPATPSAPLNTFQKWNDLEQIINDVYTILLNNFYYYCGGEIYAGNEIGLLL